MNKIYDKLSLIIACLVLAGGVFLYLQTTGKEASVGAPGELRPADNPYQARAVPESVDTSANWPEVSEQSTGWRYDVFTPPKIFIDAEGRFSAEGWTPPPPPVPFGVYLADIQRKPYRIQLEGYIEEDTSDASKSLLLFFDEERDRQLRVRPGNTAADSEFELREFTIQRVRNEEGGIERVAKAVIYDLRKNETVTLRHGQRRYDSGVTVLIRSNEHPDFELSLSEAPAEFETPGGSYTLQEINLEDSSITVEKHSTEETEPETKTLQTRARSSTGSTSPASSTDQPAAPESDSSFNDLDSFF
ncbi:MAG: hypothetical protein EA353_13335 [Puniceicoccaceae bacterium]|nr:MAG: hypothetical protein EA353_13335 [Puniceicoccaceae bacterium]